MDRSRPYPDPLNPAQGASLASTKVGVDPDGAEVQSRRQVVAASGVLGPHRGGQAVGNGVGAVDGVGFVGEGFDGDDRSEDFLTGAFGAVGHIGEHGGRDEVSGAGDRCSADSGADSLCAGPVKEAADRVEVRLRHERADLDILPGAGFAHHQGADFAD
jgi:hypothetical protein